LNKLNFEKFLFFNPFQIFPMKPMPRTYCLFIALAVIWMMPNPSYALTDTIHGIINICTPVLGIDSCNATLVVKKSYGFSANDRVILIQMQGATISVADDSTYGNLVSLGLAGNYELTTVESVHGNTIQLKYRLERSYDVKGSVQLVRVPHYTGNVFIDTLLTAKPWDGKCGGILALIVDSTLRNKGRIDVSGSGFRISLFAASGDSTAQQGYLYQPASGRAGMKGESIVANSLNVRAGRGRQANGGGGGNAFHSGGGGGGNAGSGGNGGKQYSGASGGADSIGGKGGLSITDTNATNRLFMGGSGGSGHQSGYCDGGIRGGPGGGIIFIRCKTLWMGSDNYMWAQGGNQQDVVGNAGGGGGGAGGTILLDVDSVYSDESPITLSWISVSGGNGAKIDLSPSTGNPCRGPGGGGGAGKGCGRHLM
jgi:hypothetical protein